MIFISYRKEDTKADVTHLARRLALRYGHQNVFVDYNNIAPGDQWQETIGHKLTESRIILGVVGSNWGLCRFPSGSGRKTGWLRLQDPDDVLRRELCTAVRRAKDKTATLIIVTIDGAILPETGWDCELDELGAFQRADLRTQGDFESTFEGLCLAIEGAAPELCDVANRSVGAQRPASSAGADDLADSLQRYVDITVRMTATIQLPLISPAGQPFIAPLKELRIDLPLLVSHEHAVGHSDAVRRWRGWDPLTINDALRTSHTNALLVDRASRFDDLARDCDLGSRLDIGARAIIIGDPGCGKSTLLQWLAQFYGSRWGKPDRQGGDEGLPPRDWFPILIPCRELAGRALPARLFDLLQEHLRQRQFSETRIARLAAHLERLLEAGKAILLIDGLDEIPQSDRRAEFCALLAAVALRFPDAPIIATSRVVGFQAVREQLAARFDHLVVGPLDNDAKRTFVRLLEPHMSLSARATEGLIAQVCQSRVTAKLTDNVLLLALVAQMRAIDGALPARRVDVYRRAVDIMLQRQRPFAGAALQFNEVMPHLQFLAYKMRRQGVQRLNEVEAIALFHELRGLEPDEPVLRARAPGDLLQACIEALGVLTVAGNTTDDRGFDRRVVQFFHQSFQEYFAGQAIKHRRGGIGGDAGPVAQIRAELAGLTITRREVNIFGRYKLTEPVIADHWQDTVRMLVADLPAGDADDAIQMLLPEPSASFDEARPRAVFALQCLADEPPVGDATVDAVFDAVIDALGDDDGMSLELNTWMDGALGAAGESRFGPRLSDRLVADFGNARNEQRYRIGCSALVVERGRIPELKPETADAVIAGIAQRLSSRTSGDRVRAALIFIEQCYRLNGKLGFLDESQRSTIFDALLRAIDTDEPTRAASLWALNWLCGTRLPKILPDDECALPIAVAQRIEALLHEPDMCHATLVAAAMALTRQTQFTSIFAQQDWIYNLAVIADGGGARRDLQAAKPPERELGLDWGSSRLLATSDSLPLRRLPLAFGAFGVFRPEFVPALQALVVSSKYHNDERDAATLYLAMTGTPEAVAVLTKMADTPPDGDDDYLYGRGLFGLLYLDDIEILAAQIRKALPHSDITAYAYGLAGSRDPRGKDVLHKLRRDPNARTREAARTALEKFG